jgi:alpha-beta hydrolase superfamily lysophospholipase
MGSGPPELLGHSLLCTGQMWAGGVAALQSRFRIINVVIVGEHDAATPPSCARAIAASIDGASLEVVPDAGHLTAVEQPDRVAALLGPFFDRCFGQSAS